MTVARTGDSVVRGHRKLEDVRGQLDPIPTTSCHTLHPIHVVCEERMFTPCEIPVLWLGHAQAMADGRPEVYI